ncbi:MAG: DUF2815 family protein [Oscillospiraceae bacterium]|jgi:hypothetical protein|nr:DUF2815 family protein [Oscillospiraceae bacterium]
MATASQIATGKVRFSFCNLFQPRAQQDGQEPKYGVTLIIPKTDKATLAKINSAIEAAKANYLARNAGKKVSKDLKTTLHDGDGERPNGEAFGEECKGAYVITASSKSQPVILYADKTPIIDPKDLYSGCYGRAILNFYVYDVNGNKGVTAALNGVMKLHDGEPLIAGIVRDSDWDSWEDEEDSELLG